MKRFVCLLLAIAAIGTVRAEKSQIASFEGQALTVRMAVEDFTRCHPQRLIDNPEGGLSGASIKFDKRGWIKKEPLEELTGLPKGIQVEYYGLLIPDAALATMSWSENVKAGKVRFGPSKKDVVKLYPDYDFERKVDGYVSFAVGFDGDQPVAVVDSNNNEDLSDDDIVAFRTAYFCVENQSFSVQFADQPPQHAKMAMRVADVVASFDYWDGEKVCSAQVPFGLYDSNRKGGIEAKAFSDPYEIRGEIAQRRRGQVKINDRVFDVAIETNSNRFGTYRMAECQIVWDVNGNGMFEEETRLGEAFKAKEPFNIDGVSLEVARIASDGQSFVLKPADQYVAPVVVIDDGSVAPDFEVTTLDGQALRLSDLKGKPVVLNFWAIGCGPCRVEIPGLNELVKEFGNDVAFIAPALDKPDALAKYLSKTPFDYQIVANGDEVHKQYSVTGLPTHIIIDRDGVIHKLEIGGSKKRHEDLRPMIAEVLGKPVATR